MPIYEYRCKKCGAEFEELTLARDGAAVTCKKCSSPQVNRILSTFAVGSQTAPARVETGPCASCGAAQRGMCGIE